MIRINLISEGRRPVAAKEASARRGLDRTLFDRLIARPGESISRMLTVQYRMHEAIMDWSSRALYDGKLTAHPSVRRHLLSDLESVASGAEGDLPLLLIDTAGCDLEETESEDDESRANPGENEIVAAHVDRLIELSRSFPVRRVALTSIREIDEVYWFNGEDEQPTRRKLLLHMRLIDECDLSYPIILSAEGRVMDGMHRVAKALMEGRLEIEALRFEQDPEPDHIGRKPRDLPY